MFSRWVLVSCLAVATVWNPIVPAEHIHESEHHGSIHHLVHRHIHGHFESIPHEAEHDALGADHHDGPVVALDVDSAMPSAVTGFTPAVPVVVLLAPPADPVIHRTRDHLALLIHGPPRTSTGLRAPPPSSHL